jgi:trk system potassium uptake protein TrkA
LLPGLFPKLDFTIACIERDGISFIPTEDDQLILDDEVFFIASAEHVSSILECFGYASPVGRRVIIMGAGSIGLTLATELENSYSHMDVKIIEKSQERAEYIAQHLKKTEVMCGDVLDFQLLQEANIDVTETVVSVTEDDKVNILSSLLAKRHGAGRALTLLNNMDYSPLVMSLGVDAVICPHDITVSSILQYVRRGQIHSAHSLHDGTVEVIEAEPKENSTILGLTVEDININGKIRIAALVREDKIHLSPTKASIRIGDRVIIVALKEAVHKVERLFTIRPSFL